MSAGRYDITIDQGATFTLILRWKDSLGAVIPLTGYSARMMMRKCKDSETPFIDVDTVSGELVITEVDGQIDVTIPAADTEAITEAFGVYDLEIEDGSGVVTRLLEGEVAISREVTHD